MSAKSCEQSCDHGAEDHHRQIDGQGGGSGDGDGHGHLADAVADGGQGACHPQLPVGQNFPQADGDENRAEAAGAGIEDGAEISREHRAQKDPDKEDRRRFLCSQGKNREDRHNVGKAQFDARDGDKGRDLGFDHEDRQSDGRQHGHEGQFSYFRGHRLLTLSKYIAYQIPNQK